MSIDLDLHPYSKPTWPKKKPVKQRARKDLSLRNWHYFFDILGQIPSKEMPENVVLVDKYRDETHVTTTAPSTGQRYRYLPASKVAAAMKKAFDHWDPIKPGEEWYEEDRETRKRYQAMLRKLKKLPGRTPVILDWH